VKRTDRVDDDGDPVMSLAWGDSISVSAAIVGPTDEPDGVAFLTSTIKNAHFFLGNVDAEDLQALAMFYADAAAKLRGEG
jgi:hypothetical protein